MRLWIVFAISVVVVFVALFFNASGRQHTVAADISTADEDEFMDTVVFETSMGEFAVKLNRQKAPLTVENFVGYVKAGQYDGTIFHRVIKGFMIQGGGFDTGAVEKPVNSPIKLESKNGLKNKRATVAMARTNDPDSATSQFFVNTVDNDFLDYAPGNQGYAVFGQVIEGMDVVEKIESVPTLTKGRHRDWPSKDVVIKKAYLRK